MNKGHKGQMSDREAMKLALEALVEARDDVQSWGAYASEYFQKKHDLAGHFHKYEKAITALRQALEQPECADCNGMGFRDGVGERCRKCAGEGAEPEQEPVAYLYKYRDGWTSQLRFDGSKPMEVKKLYTAPPKREWVGLTDEEIFDLYFDGFSISQLKDFARAIEAKLKEKNA